MLWLFGASCFFYMCWNPWLILLILFSSSVDYIVALRLEAARSLWTRRLLLVASVATNLGLLAYFKYANFFLANVSGGLGLLGLDCHLPILSIVLPLGISFYTFETISYIVDVYRGKIRAVANPLDYALYIMFFPHLVAGPIVRPGDFLPQLHRRKHWNWNRLHLGAQLFVLGLFKKAVIADHLGPLVDPVFASPEEYSTAALWIALFGYAAQIYCDFSGYSDMAIGLAHTLGFKLPMNFNNPYLAANIGETWQRWHISLSTWLRDYLYLPMGGSRRGTLIACRNLFLTMLVAGLWHGPAWNFVCWGGFNGILLAVRRICKLPGWLTIAAFRPVWVAITFLSFCVGLAIFRAQSLVGIGSMLRRLALPMPGRDFDAATIAIVAIGVSVVFAIQSASEFIDLEKVERRLAAPVLGAGLAGLLLLVFMLMPTDGQLFVYFQF
jgi:alginate O-acetyltransferase complex protein AlgI